MDDDPLPYEMLPDISIAAFFARKCLSCRKDFRTHSRFIRVCASCKSTDGWQYGDEFSVPGLTFRR